MPKTVPESKFQEWKGLDRISLIVHEMKSEEAMSLIAEILTADEENTRRATPMLLSSFDPMLPQMFDAIVHLYDTVLAVFGRQADAAAVSRQLEQALAVLNVADVAQLEAQVKALPLEKLTGSFADARAVIDAYYALQVRALLLAQISVVQDRSK